MENEWQFEYMDLHVFPGGGSGFVAPAGEPVPLMAWGVDKHYLLHRCRCPALPGDESIEAIPVEAVSMIDWTITDGNGSFVNKSATVQGPGQLSPGDARFQSDCEAVLFQPPVLDDDQPASTRIKVEIHHEDATKPPDHDPIQSFITLKVSRRKVQANQKKKSGTRYEYVYECAAEEGNPLHGSAPPPKKVGACEPWHHWINWRKVSANISQREFLSPDDIKYKSDAEIHQIYSKIPIKCNYGDLIRFAVKGSDTDDIELRCVPNGKGPCKNMTNDTLRLTDVVKYHWTADNGSFPLSKAYEEQHGRAVRQATAITKDVVWRAPNHSGVYKVVLMADDSRLEYVDEPYYTEILVEVLEPEEDDSDDDSKDGKSGDEKSSGSKSSTWDQVVQPGQFSLSPETPGTQISQNDMQMTVTEDEKFTPPSDGMAPELTEPDDEKK
jgi:hypothetical protein